MAAAPDPAQDGPRYPLPRWLERAAGVAGWPLWAGYAVSGLFYVVQIRGALRAARAPGFVPAVFGASGWAPEIFFLVGTAHWVTVGAHRAASPPQAALSMGLAGLHILLFAVRVWLAPLLYVLDATAH